jgi:hypothetical protein
MDGFSSWVDSHFNVIQTVGVIGSLLMTALAADRDAKTRNVENLLVISEHHRELWAGARQRVELERIFQDDAKGLDAPVTVAEEEFLNLVMAHFQTSWRIAKAGGIITLGELADDVRGFFSLPLPRAVWEKTKGYRNRMFVQFVEHALEPSTRLNRARA